MVSADEGPGTLYLSSVEPLVPADIESAIRSGAERVVRSPAGVSFFSSGLVNNPPPNVEPLVAVKLPAGAPSFFSPSLGRPNRLVVVVGVASFFSSGFAASLFVVVVPKSPPPAVPPVPPNEKPPVFWGTGVDVLDVSGFWVLPNNPPPPNAGVVAEVEVEVAALSAGFGGSPKNPPGAGAVVVVVVDESPADLGGPPNSPPVVVVALSDPPKRPPDVAVGG